MRLLFGLLLSAFLAFLPFLSGPLAVGSALVLLTSPAQVQAREAAPPRIPEVALDELPVQALRTFELILRGGPFPYQKDGTVFFNREGLLPRKARGYYTEYTVPTPRARNRGARRIVAGGGPGRPSEFYYTDDHYASFRKIRDPIR